MASSNNTNEQARYEGGRPIQLIRCIPPTDKERDNPQYIPQLEVIPEAQKIISECFDAPISVIVYVGNMGVGKSKLATMTVAALKTQQPAKPSGIFQSGAGSNGITRGVWMWSEPLRNPKQNPDENGSVLILDCEGMGDLDENTGANLYLFCMLISTAFVVVLRPPRVDRHQCNRLYHALKRFKQMRTQFVLPNLWLVPTDLPDFVKSDPNSGEDIPISERNWVNNIFTIDEENNRLSNEENRNLKIQYECILQTLPNIRATNIHGLPVSLQKNSRNLDTYSLLRSTESCQYAKSIRTAIEKFLEPGGKRLLGSTAKNMFVRPSEFAAFIADLIHFINQHPEPIPDDVINQYLANRFTAEIEIEYFKRFERDLMRYVTNQCEKLKELKSIPTDEQINAIIGKIKQKRAYYSRQHMDRIICETRHEILGLDSTLMSGFSDDTQRQRAISNIPVFIRNRLNIIETKMNDYYEPILLIERARQNLITDDLRQKSAHTEKLLSEALEILNIKKENLQQEKIINESLARRRPWRVGLPPCENCGMCGGAYNMLHVRCKAPRQGNLYYASNMDGHMVCDSCRYIIRCDPKWVRCTNTNCGAKIRATKVF